MRTLHYALVTVLLVGCQHRPAPEHTHADTLFPATMAVGTVDKTAALSIARCAVANNDAWLKDVFYSVKKEGTGWLITAIHRDSSGKVTGGDRQIHINEQAAVTAYVRGQ